ncbi:putative pyridoxal kinase [Parelaphostrongylus tenuis]|uniref:pyridoxal kinase n=1 Tax=Parelaphostrongylus tenuis TaxID=148309 RepID=A0AAD5MI22_PARTN|nr:putative pyridoxal kinase [Parelaphostrongylus tenuis]
MTVEEALRKEQNKAVLSIQSHVVHGYAGNKASVFPLQLNGFEVDPINSVQFSNHAGNVEFLTLPKRYKYVKGQRLTNVELTELYDGLKLNAINEYSFILTGYCGNVAFLNKIADIVKDLKTTIRL